MGVFRAFLFGDFPGVSFQQEGFPWETFSKTLLCLFLGAKFFSDTLYISSGVIKKGVRNSLSSSFEKGVFLGVGATHLWVLGTNCGSI